jgi:hypothetical protein
MACLPSIYRMAAWPSLECRAATLLVAGQSSSFFRSLFLRRNGHCHGLRVGTVLSRSARCLCPHDSPHPGSKALCGARCRDCRLHRGLSIRRQFPRAPGDSCLLRSAEPYASPCWPPAGGARQRNVLRSLHPGLAGRIAFHTWRAPLSPHLAHPAGAGDFRSVDASFAVSHTLRCCSCRSPIGKQVRALLSAILVPRHLSAFA